jgi:hypothetical protein
MRAKFTNFFSTEKNTLLQITLWGMLWMTPCCKERTTPSPLSQETFISFYAELLLLGLQQPDGRDSLRMQMNRQNVAELLKRYKTTKEQVFISAEKFSLYPEQWKEIMDSVAERMRNHKHFDNKK